MKEHLSSPLLAILLLLQVVVSVQPVRADVLADTRQQQIGFERSLCQQDWREALQISAALMASPEVSQEYKNFLEAFQPMLEQYSRQGVFFFVNVPWCGGSAGMSVNAVEETVDSIVDLRPYWSGLVNNGGSNSGASQ